MQMLFLAFSLLVQGAAPEQAPGPPESAPTVGDTVADGLSREQMWRAPTPEDWARPVLIPFQRSWADAVAVSKETGKPILACINMDGEIASEHYAGVRYRQADVAALYEPYVCVIASVYRHNAQDFGPDGERILCPRFGSVTCGEHIALEPRLFQLYLDETRVAPRHIVVELDGTESQDLYYANDTASVFRLIHESAQGRPEPRQLKRADRPLVERLASADLESRTALEAAFAAGDLPTRRSLLQAALAAPGLEHNQLWRLALHSGSPELARLAVLGLSSAKSPAAIDLILASLRGLESAGDREVLVTTLERIGANSERARQLVRSFRGLSARSQVIDGSAVGQTLAASGGVQRDSAVAKLVALDRGTPEGSGSYGGAAKDSKGRALVALERARAQLALARSPKTDARYVALHLEDTSRELDAARSLADTDQAWRWELVDIAFDLARGGGPVWTQAAEDRAAALVPRLPAGARAEGGLVLRDVLSAFVRARERGIRKAVRTKSEWPAGWMADGREAFLAIQTAPATTAAEFIGRQDFLRYMGTFKEADGVLELALGRFPTDALVHDRLRARLLSDRRLDAIDGLEGRYEALLAAPDAPPVLEWYAGYASRSAAEVERRAGQLSAASEAYGRAIAHFARGGELDPTTLASGEFQTALCLAGQARIAADLGEGARATALLLQSFERGPEAAATLDGLNVSAILTARVVRAALGDEAVQPLVAALDKLRALDPHLFDPPAFERKSIGQPPVGFGNAR